MAEIFTDEWAGAWCPAIRASDACRIPYTGAPLDDDEAAA